MSIDFQVQFGNLPYNGHLGHDEVIRHLGNDLIINANQTARSTITKFMIARGVAECKLM